MNFDKQVSLICKKVGNQLNVTIRFRKLIYTSTMLKLYKAFVLPHFQYWRKRRLSTIEAKRDSGFFGNYYDSGNNSSHSLNFCLAEWQLMYLFLYCALCFSCNCVYCHAVHVRCSAIINKFWVKSLLVSVRWRQEKVMSHLYRRKIVLWRK